jgi:aspartyl-tRNA synthetase
MDYADAMKYYGSDKPDIRFGMKFVELNDVAKNKGFQIFDDAELVVGIVVEGCADYTRKQLDKLTDFVRKPQIGAKGMIYVKCLSAEQAGNGDGSFKSSVDKFFDQQALKEWADKMRAKSGDLILVLSGETEKVRKQLSELRFVNPGFLHHYGLLTFHCLNGTKIQEGIMLCIILLHLQNLKTLICLTQNQVRFVPMLMIL